MSLQVSRQSLVALCLFTIVSGASLAESFWDPVMRKDTGQAGRALRFDKSKPEIAGIRLGMPALAARRELTLTQEPPLVVSELYHDDVPGSYGLMAFDASPACRQQDICQIRMRVLYSRAKVWFVAREYLAGPYATDVDAQSALREALQELALHYGLLTAPPGDGPGLHPSVDRYFDKRGAELAPGSACHEARAQRVVGIEPLAFPPICGWSYRHALETFQQGKAYYVKGVLQLADLEQLYPEMTEPRARAADARR
jgi:hypothetical protein